MIIAKHINQYKDTQVYFCDPIKNNIMLDGKFIRIIYSTNNFILNGVSVCMDITDAIMNKYYNKYKVSFCTTKNKDLIDQIGKIEYSLLHKGNIEHKQPVFKITEQLLNGNIKLFTDDENIVDMKSNTKYILKISGIWETERQYGLTYKFIMANHQL